MKSCMAVLVISCDRYRDVWDPFFALFERFWPDCPYKLYLGVNHADYCRPNVTVLKAGDDVSWADNVRTMLAQIEEEYVLTFLEDFFISFHVNTDKIAEALELATWDGVDVVSLILPKKGKPYPGRNGYYFIDPAAEYCVNTSIAIRRKTVFMDLLKSGFSAWDFEVNNSRAVNQIGAFPGLFLTADTDLFRCLNGIWRGKWVQRSVRFCRRLGIEVDTSMRPAMSFSERCWEYAKVSGRKLLPVFVRKLAKRLLVGLGFSKRFVSID